MQLKQLIQDKDAVSPVIGVILMVAITVILAAVIGTFVLGLGENVQTTTPSASFGFDYEAGASGDFSGANTDEKVTITHKGGDTIEAAQVEVTIGGTGYSTLSSDASSLSQFPDPIKAGSTYTFTEGGTNAHLEPGASVKVVWTSESGQNSAVLGESKVPN